MTSSETVQPTTTHRHTWVPYLGAAAGGCLLLKAVLIIGSDDAVGDGPMAVLYLLGLLLGVVAAVGAGLRRDRVGVRIAIAVAGVVALVLWIMGLGDALKPVVALVSDAEHVKDEVPVGVAGIVLLALSWHGWSRDVSAPAAGGRPGARPPA